MCMIFITIICFVTTVFALLQFFKIFPSVCNVGNKLYYQVMPSLNRKLQE